MILQSVFLKSNNYFPFWIPIDIMFAFCHMTQIIRKENETWLGAPWFHLALCPWRLGLLGNCGLLFLLDNIQGKGAQNCSSCVVDLYHKVQVLFNVCDSSAIIFFSKPCPSFVENLQHWWLSVIQRPPTRTFLLTQLRSLIDWRSSFQREVPGDQGLSVSC